MSAINSSPVIVGSIYHGSPPVVIDGQFVPLQCDSQGRLLNSPSFTWNLFTNFGTASSFVVKVSPGFILNYVVRNSSASERFLQLFDRTTLPTTGAVPMFSASLPIKASNISMPGFEMFGLVGIQFATGIVAAFSTTQGTYTAAGPGDHGINLSWR